MQVSDLHKLHHVLYVSRATSQVYPDQADCVREILRTAVGNNRRLDVTGALLACDNWFVQVLEGRRADVGFVLNRVKDDPSHDDIRLVACGPIDKRRFAQWSMCASTFSPTDHAIVSTLQASGRFDARKLDAEGAINLLRAVSRLQRAPAVQKATQ